MTRLRVLIVGSMMIALTSVVAARAATVQAESASKVANVDVSRTGPDVAAAVPLIALDPARPHRVLIAWRSFTIPLRGNVPVVGGRAVCYLSISDDDGAHFRTLAPPLTTPEQFCNAPWVAVAGDAIVVGATITGGPVPPGTPRSGETLVGLVRTTDDGATWSARVAPISSADTSRFVLRPGIDAARLKSAHDGARGMYDARTATLYVSGAHPEPPDSANPSQRFVTASHDGGRSFGKVFAFDSAQWPGRWDGTLAIGKGGLVLSYVGGATPGGARCPCVVVGAASDDGATIVRSLVAPASAFSMADLVHVPALAADPSRAGRYAVGVIGADDASTRIYLTEDGGKRWRAIVAPQPAGVTKVTRVGVAFAPDGTLIATWRGAYDATRYDLFASVLRGRVPAPAIRISSETSTRPATIPLTGFEGGDFVSWVSADATAAHFAWADARDGASVRIFYARVLLATLRNAR